MKAWSLTLLLAFGAWPAMACDCVTLDPKSPRYAKDLDAIAAFYPVAAEGRLEKNGPLRWRFIPVKEMKGPGQSSYDVGIASDCSLDPAALDALAGKQVFLLLALVETQPTPIYEAGRCVNGLPPGIEQAIRDRVSTCSGR